jgi:hypothetical protein
MKALKLFAGLAVFGFAGIGMVFTGVFVAMEFGWLNVRGSIEARNNSILNITNLTDSLEVTIDRLPARAIQVSTTSPDHSCTDETATCPWQYTREWQVVAGGLQKDIAIINRVASETDVPARLIAAVIVPEQIRFFTSNREVFKRYFEPLKLLGSLSKFSLGVSGIKQETAVAIEQHLINDTSSFYPGPKYAALVQYSEDDNRDATLFNRLTDEKDHYYSYLYTALFIKEILAQWERAGYDLSTEPAIIATIFNLGFSESKPKSNPQIGGSWVTVGGTKYPFGQLAGFFYESDELPALTK